MYPALCPCSIVALYGRTCRVVTLFVSLKREIRADRIYNREKVGLPFHGPSLGERQQAKDEENCEVFLDLSIEHRNKENMKVTWRHI